ncbi:MAG: alpha-L-rhamnosidase C-terminal domain-containing protein [Algibacter sp.]
MYTKAKRENHNSNNIFSRTLLTKCVLAIFILMPIVQIQAQDSWQANWIAHPNNQDTLNSWFNYRKDFSLENVPNKAIAKIAVDTKYWMWINDNLVVFEGGLKRGPNPNDTYYDEIDIAKHLNTGKNTIAILTWYFGKEGFSHKSSGATGLLFQCIAPEVTILSDATWKVSKNLAYQTCDAPDPNFRLPESNIKYDGRLDMGKWYLSNFNVNTWSSAKILGMPPIAPWNKLILRPIPFWKNSGFKKYTNNIQFPFTTTNDTVITCNLPSNIQITPYLKVESIDGKVIDIRTDNTVVGDKINLRAEYITRKGVQDYESLGWLNGHKVIYTIPKGVKVLDLKYRETGYDTDFSGGFNSSDDFLNLIWKKSLRTLYVTMRDNYMDCPDRERAQWWGDAVNEGGEAFYALDTKSHLLFKKGMYELIGWQREDDVLFSPIPAGNWTNELPSQMLASIGYYGFWNYYLHTGDKQTISDIYDGVHRYLKLWKINEKGNLIFRKGDWTWGDWGEEKDMELIFNGFYYLALKGAANMANALEKSSDVEAYTQAMEAFKIAYNKSFWTGTSYRHPDYKGKTDDRSQALAVVSGLADKDKYPALLNVFKTEEHASPYTEKYVLEALFQMGYGNFGLERMRKRFNFMVNHPDYTTLFEGWEIANNSFGGGTVNHAWSGGGLTILSQYLCGVSPTEPGYSVFKVTPQPCNIKHASAKIASVMGLIETSFENNSDNFKLSVNAPKNTNALVGIPAKNYGTITLNGIEVWKQGQSISNKNILKYEGLVDGYFLFRMPEGSWKFEASK